jgi:hypothetical protein
VPAGAAARCSRLSAAAATAVVETTPRQADQKDLGRLLTRFKLSLFRSLQISIEVFSLGIFLQVSFAPPISPPVAAGIGGDERF